MFLELVFLEVHLCAAVLFRYFLHAGFSNCPQHIRQQKLCCHACRTGSQHTYALRTELCFLCGHFLVVEASGPKWLATTGNGHLLLISDLTGPAKRHNSRNPIPGSSLQMSVCNWSPMPLGLPGTDWVADSPPWPGMRERERGQNF